MVVIQWFGPSGELLNSGAARGNASLPLNFEQLSLSDAGRYVCRAMIFSPLLDGPRTIETNLDLLPERDTGSSSTSNLTQFDINLPSRVRNILYIICFHVFYLFRSE